jgi:tRNA threonylcarbamoyladenosine biosynthesis protein TsaE
VEWGEGLAERLSERHLDIRLERVSHSDTRIATWEWNSTIDTIDAVQT